MAIYKEIKVKNILNKTTLPGVDFTINPYIGCEHACAYCYARFIYKIFDIDPARWGEHVFVKINAIDVLKKELRKAKGKRIFIGSATDPYQPAERIYKLTRGILEVLSNIRCDVSILTKSSLILRDLDVIKKMNAEIGVSLTSLDNIVYKEFEPRTAPPMERIRILENAKKKGIRTYVFIAPFLPIFTEQDFEEIIVLLKRIGISEIYVDKLNLKAKNWITISAAIRRIDSSIFKEFWMRAKDENYWERLKKEIMRLSEYYGIDIVVLF